MFGDKLRGKPVSLLHHQRGAQLREPDVAEAVLPKTKLAPVAPEGLWGVDQDVTGVALDGLPEGVFLSLSCLYVKTGPHLYLCLLSPALRVCEPSVGFCDGTLTFESDSYQVGLFPVLSYPFYK